MNKAEFDADLRREGYQAREGGIEPNGARLTRMTSTRA